MKYTIARFINNICLNPKEYALTDEGEVKLFTKEEALEVAGYDSIEDAEEDWIFISSSTELEVDNT